MKKRNGFLKASVAISFILIGVITAILVLPYLNQPMIEQAVHQKKIILGWLGDPAGDDSGFCTYYHYTHSGTPAVTYASNLSTATAYEYIESLSGEMTGETPHGVAIDYVCKIRVNDTVAYNATSGLWEPNRIYMNVTVDYNFGSDIAWTQMTLVEIANNSDFAWYNGYINGGGAGYTLTANQKTNSSLNCTVLY